jgi:hypothetical protein
MYSLDGPVSLVVRRVLMKRDMELVRKIIFVVEDSPTGYAPDNLEIQG